MQNLIVYLCADGTSGVSRDFANAQNVSLPQLVRGIEAIFRFRVFAELDSMSPYPLEQLRKIAAWQFVMDSDYTEETAYKLEADNASIRIEEVLENGNTYTEISVPMPHTNTKELAEWMGDAKSKSGLVGELVGFNTEGKPAFILQIENWTIKNRVTSAGSPTEVKPDYVTTGEVRGLIAGQVKELTPKISESGTWVVDGVDTGLPSRGEQGIQGIQGIEGKEGKQGEKGEKGDPMKIDATGTTAELSQYDAEPKGFSFLATDTGMVYIKDSDTSGDWSDPVGFQGPAGSDGYTPVRGTDYWTEEDISTIKSYVEESIINGEW